MQNSQLWSKKELHASIQVEMNTFFWLGKKNPGFNHRIFPWHTVSLTFYLSSTVWKREAQDLHAGKPTNKPRPYYIPIEDVMEARQF